jgi:hypothetical protein
MRLSLLQSCVTVSIPIILKLQPAASRVFTDTLHLKLVSLSRYPPAVHSLWTRSQAFPSAPSLLFTLFPFECGGVESSFEVPILGQSECRCGLVVRELKSFIRQFAICSTTIFDRHLQTPEHNCDQTVVLSAILSYKQ